VIERADPNARRTDLAAFPREAPLLGFDRNAPPQNGMQKQDWITSANAVSILPKGSGPARSTVRRPHPVAFISFLGRDAAKLF